MPENFDWMMGFVLPYVNFAIFIALIIIFARKPLNAMAFKRRRGYQELFAEAKKVKQEAEAKAKELDERLASLDKEIAELLSNAKRTAQNEHDEALKSANELAQHLTSEAGRVAEAELDNALRSLRQDIVKQVTTQVGERFEKELNSEKQAAIVDHRIDKLRSLEMGKAH